MRGSGPLIAALAALLLACAAGEQHARRLSPPSRPSRPATVLTPPSFTPRYAPGYSRSWGTLHADSSNSDYAPFATSIELEEQWRALEGAGPIAAPSIAPDGRLFVTTARGRGTAHLHALSPEGAILWESAPQESRADLDSGAGLSAPVVDDRGDVFVGDSNQFWSFDRDGRVRWRTELDALGVQGPFVTAVIVGDAVGGVTIHGQMLLLERSSGAPAAPVLELPGGASPTGRVPGFVWNGGLVDPEARTRVMEVLMGLRYEVTNTPAVHPRTGRIYLMAAGRTLDEGLFYGIDLVDGELRIAFETPTAPGTGTSPAISADGSKVYAFGGGGELIAIDSETGALVFESEVEGTPASPSVAPDGSVYVLAAAHLRKVDGGTGAEIWSRNYDEFARDELPSLSAAWPLVANGEPVARLDSVITITPNLIWTSLLCGYELRVAGRDLVQPRRTYLAAIAPETGELLAWYPIPDTSEGTISVGRRGELYANSFALQASIGAWAPYRFLLPGSLRVEPPRGGIVAFAPASQRPQIAAGLRWAGRLLRGAALAPPEPQREVLELARAQLDATRGSLALAEQRDEMTRAEQEILGGIVREALESITSCAAPNAGEQACGELAAKARSLQALGGAFH